MKKLIFATVAFVFAGNVFAKTEPTEAFIVKYNNNGDVVWEKSGGNIVDNYSSATAVPDGVVAVGSSNGSGIIVKYDNDGNIVWEKKGNSNYFSSVIAVPDGVVALGMLYKNNSNTITVKYDLNGKIVWEKKELGECSHSSLTAVPDGIVTVWNCDEGGDGFSLIRKYDSKGKVVWKKNSECFGDCQLTTVPDGVVAVGSYYPEAIIIKYNNKGNVVWKKTKKMGKDDEFSSVTPVSDGVLVVGKPRTSSGKSIIIKYDNEGKETAWKTNSNKNHSSIIAVSDGLISLALVNNTNAMIYKYDYDGNIVWEKSYGGSVSNSYFNVTAVPDGVVLVGANYTKTIDDGYAKGGSGGIGDMSGGLIGGSAGVGTKVKGSLKAPSASDIDMGSGDGSRSKAEIMAVVNARMPGIRNIYNKYLKLKPELNGKVILKFTIAPSGDIVEINIVSSTTDYGEFDNAIKNMVATWKWKAIKSGNTTTTIPFNFTN